MLSYSTLFSRVLNKINDPKELQLNTDDLLSIYTERLHSVVGDERIVEKFSKLILDDEIQEIDFEMKYPVSDLADKEYVLELFSLGMTIEWLKQQVDSRIYTARALGGKEEKNMQNHYKPMQERLHELESQFSRKLARHGYINNSYINGDK